MKNIRILQIVFDTEIAGHEVAAFRGAVIEKAGREHAIFHNHIGDGFIYKYPLIQYKRVGNKPCIMCIECGTDEIQKFFTNRNWEDIRISDRYLNMKISKLNLNQFNIRCWNQSFAYTIRYWIALNQENYLRYRNLTTEQEKREMLENMLKANILSFAKGIEWTVDEPIQVKITNTPEIRKVTLKQKPVLGFNLEFTSNVFLPDHIGLGKSVSLGFGTVQSKRTAREQRVDDTEQTTRKEEKRVLVLKRKPQESTAYVD